MKINTKPLPGMMELLPEEQIEFNRILNVIKKHHSQFGFVSIDTPIIERTETLLAKAGGETEKQIYRFKKGDNDLSLRFDLTVPTARYTANNLGQLLFPFKRSQIGKVYRGERAQRGRFREFYQCDIDIICKEKMSVNYDAEVIAVIYSIFKELSFGDFTLRISNRNLISGIIGGLKLGDKADEIMALIDRAEKITPTEFEDQANNLELGDKIEIIKKFINCRGDIDNVLIKLKDIANIINNEQFILGINELEALGFTLLNMGVDAKNICFDMLIVRGLDYYTGTVFETSLNDFKQIGSIASGGRYDNLCGYYSKEKLMGVGASIGLTRLFWTLRELGLLNFNSKTTAKYLIMPMGEKELVKAYSIASEIRRKGKNVEVLLEPVNAKKAFKIADKKGVEFAMLIGEKELQNNAFKFKNMSTGKYVDVADI